jgi:hypothetical protein
MREVVESPLPFEARAGSQPGHRFPAPGGPRRTRTDTTSGNLSSVGHQRSRRDTRGQATKTVRDREAQGSNPRGPDPVLTSSGSNPVDPRVVQGLPPKALVAKRARGAASRSSHGGLVAIVPPRRLVLGCRQHGFEVQMSLGAHGLVTFITCGLRFGRHHQSRRVEANDKHNSPHCRA